MKKKKLAIIGTVGIPACYGGFETLAEHLSEELSANMELTVYCSGAQYPKGKRPQYYKGARLVYWPLKANGIQSIVYDCLSMLHAMIYADVLLVLGVPGGFLIPLIRMLTGCRIITSVDGIEWKRNKWSKWARWYLWASEWLAVKFSHANIADNEAIQDYTASRYGSLSTIIEYGADHICKEQPVKKDYEQYPFLYGTYAIKVCRIEPENNIDMVLGAFARLERYHLVLIGNWNNSNYGRLLREKYGEYANLHLLDPVYDQREIDLLRGNAMVYIHGHSAGGTNPSLVEAMYLGLPVIAFGVMYNKSTTEHRALYFRSAAELEKLIRKTKMRELRTLGAEMRQIAQRRYTWSVIADKYTYLIETISDTKSARDLTPRIARGMSSAAMLQYDISHLQHSLLFYEKR